MSTYLGPRSRAKSSSRSHRLLCATVAHYTAILTAAKRLWQSCKTARFFLANQPNMHPRPHHHTTAFAAPNGSFFLYSLSCLPNRAVIRFRPSARSFVPSPLG